MMVSIDSTWVTYYSTSIDSIVISFSKYLTCNFNKVELGVSKVIQGKRSWCQSKAHWWFFYLISTVSNIVSITVFEVFNAEGRWPKSKMV